MQPHLISKIFTFVSHRPRSACDFLPLPLLLSPSLSSSSSEQNDTPSLITYWHYAILYSILISTSTESPLALLELIPVFMQALNRIFENVCELDPILNSETLHAALRERIVKAVRPRTGLERSVRRVRAQQVVEKRLPNDSWEDGRHWERRVGSPWRKGDCDVGREVMAG